MTRQQAIELQPHSKEVYAGALVLVVLFAGLYRYSEIHSRHLPTDRWAAPLVLSLFSLYATQAIARLLFPVASAKLSRQLASSNHAKGILTCISLLVAALLITGFIRGLHSELRALANTAIMLPQALADLFGRESAYVRPTSTTPASIAPWRDYLKPIQSDHWGQR